MLEEKGIRQTWLAEKLRKGYDKFKDYQYNKELDDLANKNGLNAADLGTFVELIMSKMIFNGEKLTDC